MNTDTAAQKSDDLPDEAITIWWGAPDRKVPAGAGPLERIMDQASPTRADRRNFARGAKSLVEVCVSNTFFEDLHAGIFPRSETGDYSDVKVVTPYGQISWTELSRISDDEMKRLMIEIMNRVFTNLCFPDDLAKLSASGKNWDQPRLDSNLMKTVRRRKAAAALQKDIWT